MNNQQKIYQLFKEINTILNNYGTTPIIYGSVAIDILKPDSVLRINDLDYLLSEKDFAKFVEIKELLEKNGFSQDPDHEQEFSYKGTFVSFLSATELEKLISKSLELAPKSDFGNYLVVKQEDLLKIYQEGSKNKWRKTKKEKDDLEKIKLLEKLC